MRQNDLISNTVQEGLKRGFFTELNVKLAPYGTPRLQLAAKRRFDCLGGIIVGLIE